MASTDPDSASGATETPMRSRSATEARIVAAATAILAEEGFSAFGINSVARRAGCDKQLIYRYFGGIDGLIDAIGTALAGWIDARLDIDGGGFLLTYGDLAERMMLAYLDALRGDALMRRIIAWELAEPHPRVKVMSDARSKAMQKWLEKARGNLSAPKGVDAPALNAILIGAVQHVVLAGAHGGAQAGMALETEKDWERVRQAVIRLVRGVYP